MGKPLNIRDPRAHDLARQLATLRQTGLEEAVVGALESELRREREAIPLAERLARIAERLQAKAKPGGRDISEDERDEMWTRF
ncbi:type II toxin-antitoxin system VapB family antitoxin [Enterovirga rhinocerotis]|uniref:Antitoxin VapB n=1 Tax=Enterovirga rhinocerotis TaxID=1339210 RepID=A0A4R7C5I8_9HYPH|nr:type II toxin-antitoxin system VapB family antitoxin [Enterovirga rhinocerotis]TDR93648.1 antitoxin VapB [Enterovirga rhinocerotis]